MKLLLDECLPIKLKSFLKNFEVRTVSEMGWRSLKNGELLQAAVNEGFDILLTIDKKLEFQLDIKSFDISIVIFDVFRSKLENLLPLIPLFVNKIYHIKKGQVYRISQD